MAARISLIIPTIWRSTLTRALDSAVDQAKEGDQIIVVGDSEAASWDHVGWSKVPIVFAALGKHVGDFGCSACDYGIRLASGDYVFFLGDDDYLAPGAFEIIRRGVAEAPDLPHLFAMEHTHRVLCGSLQCGAVSGQQIVVPRDMTKMPKMVDFHPGELAVSDWRFIRNVEAAWGRIVKHEEIISILPRMNQGRML